VYPLRSLYALATLTLIGLAGTVLARGGWQAAAAGLGSVCGFGFVVGFAVIRALADRRPPRVPSLPAVGVPVRLPAPDREPGADTAAASPAITARRPVAADV
jgi:hypothetical protein